MQIDLVIVWGIQPPILYYHKNNSNQNYNIFHSLIYTIKFQLFAQKTGFVPKCLTINSPPPKATYNNSNLEYT